MPCIPLYTFSVSIQIFEELLKVLIIIVSMASQGEQIAFKSHFSLAGEKSKVRGKNFPHAAALKELGQFGPAAQMQTPYWCQWILSVSATVVASLCISNN